VPLDGEYSQRVWDLLILNIAVYKEHGKL
jgi:hypothetical protein